MIQYTFDEFESDVKALVAKVRAEFVPEVME